MSRAEQNKRFTPDEALEYLKAFFPVTSVENIQGSTVLRFSDGSYTILPDAPIDWPAKQPSQENNDYSETVEKSVQVWELDKQDRLGLVNQAIEFTGVMNSRHYFASQSSIPREVEYTDVERSTYESALKLIKREFDKGAIKTESHLVRSETEVAGR